MFNNNDKFNLNGDNFVNNIVKIKQNNRFNKNPNNLIKIKII